MWHDLFSSRGWRDDAAKQLWDEHIIKLSGYKAPEEIGEDPQVSAGRSKRRIEKNSTMWRRRWPRMRASGKLSTTLWKTRWEEDDRRWKKHLRWFK
jgi:hypothetical protein